jgi:hypothetical protein
VLPQVSGVVRLERPKLGFSNWAIISLKFLIDRVPSCLVLEIWDSVQVIIETQLKTFCALRPFQKTLTYPFWSSGTEVMREKLIF